MKNKRKEKRPEPPKTQAEIIADCAREMGMSVAAFGRKLGLQSNMLMYVGKRYSIGPALVGRAFIATGDSAVTRALAEACKEG
jgi:hypothetical protein